MWSGEAYIRALHTHTPSHAKPHGRPAARSCTFAPKFATTVVYEYLLLFCCKKGSSNIYIHVRREQTDRTLELIAILDHFC